VEVDIKYWFLRNHDLFTQLNEAEINDLCIISSFKRGKMGEIIYFSDQEIDRLYIMKQGRMKIAYYDESNQEVVSEILKEGDIFGETSLKISKNTNREFAQVLSEEVSICSFTLENFKSVLLKKPELSITYAQKVGDKLKVINSKYSDLIFKDVRSRVISFFIAYAKNEGKWDGNSVRCNMLLTHQDIANFTASSRQTTSTVIGDLAKEGKVVYEDRKTIFIPDITKLK